MYALVEKPNDAQVMLLTVYWAFKKYYWNRQKLFNLCLFLSSRGQLPADAEFNFLNHAKKLDMYGVDLHKAKVSVVIFYTLI